MEKETVMEFASHCLGCLSPRCESACPSGNHIRDFIKAVKEGDLNKAREILYSTNPLPEFTSLLCDHERQCFGSCVRGIRGTSVSIPLIENYLSNYPRPYKLGNKRGKSIALIGAGPANISAAFFLLANGYDVEFYEEERQVGGAIYTGIPPFRFDKKKLEQVHEDLVALGARFHFLTRVNKDIDFKTIRSTHHKTIIGVGAMKENMADLPHNDSIMGGLSFLRSFNLVDSRNMLRKEVRHPVIWGGGNVAIDCARAAKRIYGNSTVIYRRSLKEMPANGIEVRKALEEGVEIMFLTNISSVEIEKGQLASLNLIKTSLGEIDSSGRASCQEIAGSEFKMKCDFLIPALGERSDLSSFGQNVEGLADVYINGDAKYGAKNIAKAITSGRETAFRIIEEESSK